MRASIIYLFLTLLSFVACSGNQDQLLKDCQLGNGEACNQFGKLQSEGQQKTYFKKACDLGNTNGCVNFAQIVNREEAIPVLKFSCDKGNTRACALLAEMLTK